MIDLDKGSLQDMTRHCYACIRRDHTPKPCSYNEYMPKHPPNAPPHKFMVSMLQTMSASRCLLRWVIIDDDHGGEFMDKEDEG